MFDLTVEDAHCFYANGILVKNCHDALQYTACRLFGGMLVSPRFQEEAPPFSGEAVDLMGFGGGRSEFTGY